AAARRPGQSARRRTQAERTALSEKLILRAAIKLIARQGYSRTTLAEIGKEAGYSGGLVSHRFGSKQDRLRAEAVAHEPAAVARLLADLGQRGAAVALAGDQLDRRAQDELLREGGPLGLGAPARRLLRAPGGGSRVDRPRHGSPPPPGAR